MGFRASRLAALLAALLLDSSVALAAPLRSSNDPPHDQPAASEAPTGQLTRPPELLQFVEAPYPPEAFANRITGSVGLLVDIDATGAVTDVQVVEPAGHGFDEAAVAAVRQFRFRPAEIDHTPAAVRIAYRYSFVLRPDTDAPPPSDAPVRLRGIVLQRGNRTPVPHATISVNDGAFGAVSDDQGRFAIAGLPPGTHSLVVQAPGFDRFETQEEVVEDQVTEITCYIRKRVYSPYETVVRGRRERKEVARVELKQEEVRLIPGTQGDAFKVVQNLPGVARSPYGVGLLVVRGGRPFDTRVYVDGIWVPALFHFGGLTATFNSDLIGELSFLPGNFGASLGRATAGTLEATSRTPAKDRLHGYVNVNAIDTSALVEGPLDANWSLAGAARVSYVDLVLRQVLPSSVRLISAPRYFDYQLKAERAPANSSDRWRFMAFGSRDTMRVGLGNRAAVDPEGRDEIGALIEFHRLVGSRVHAFSESVQNQLTLALGYDEQQADVGEDITTVGKVFSLQVRDALTLKLGRGASLELGTDSYLADFRAQAVSPRMPRMGEIPDPITSRQLVRTDQRFFFFEPSLFAQAVLEPVEGTRLLPGLRLDYEHTLGYVALDPRFTIIQRLAENTSLKAAVGLYQQPPDFRAGQWTPEFGNPDLGPERSLQTSVGVEQKLGAAVSLDVQLYHKYGTRIARRSNRTIVRDGVRVPENWANEGESRSYGVELLLRHDLTERFFGWVAYSLSRTEVRNELAFDSGFRLSSFDQPHHLVLVASYKWPYDIVTGIRLQYVSGNLTTPFVASAFDSDGDYYFPFPGEANSVRTPAFLALDVRVDKRFVFDTWTLNVFLDVQNVTNNVNPEGLLYNYDYTRSAYLRGLPIFPSFGVKAEF